MTTQFPYLVSDRSATAFINGKSFTANRDHPNYPAIVDQLKQGVTDIFAFTNLFNIAKTIEIKSGGRVKITNGVVTYDGQAVHNTLTSRMLEMIQQGFDVTAMIDFMENLFQNPSFRCVNSVYDFLEANNSPITPDGFVLLFKKVRGDYYDIHSRTVLNKLASVMTEAEKAQFPKVMGNGVTVAIENGVTVVSVARNMVDENIDQTCSYGLHVCAEHYLPSFSSNGRDDRVLVCKVNPRDIVANPRDYRNAKLRVCRYEIIGEMPQEKAMTYFTAPVMTGAESWDRSNQAVETADRYADVGTLTYEDPETVSSPQTVNINGQNVTLARDWANDWVVTYVDEYGDTERFDTYREDFNEAVERAKSVVPAQAGVPITATTVTDGSTFTIAGQTVKFRRDFDGEWIAHYTDSDGDDTTYSTGYYDDIEDAVEDFKDYCVETARVYEVNVVGLTDDGDFVTTTVEYATESWEDEYTDKDDFDTFAIGELVETKLGRTDVDYDTLKVKSFKVLRTDEKLT